MYQAAKNYALYLLNFSSKSEHDIRDRLKRKEYSDEIIGQVVDFLKEYNFLNDQNLSTRIAKDSIHFKKHGKNKVKLNLKRKGISSEIIEQTLNDEVDEDTELNNAVYFAQKKLSSIKKEMDKYKLYQKLYSHLLYKGFDYNTSKKAIEKTLNKQL